MGGGVREDCLTRCSETQASKYLVGASGVRLMHGFCWRDVYGLDQIVRKGR